MMERTGSPGLDICWLHQKLENINHPSWRINHQMIADKFPDIWFPILKSNVCRIRPDRADNFAYMWSLLGFWPATLRVSTVDCFSIKVINCIRFVAVGPLVWPFLTIPNYLLDIKNINAVHQGYRKAVIAPWYGCYPTVLNTSSSRPYTSTRNSRFP